MFVLHKIVLPAVNALFITAALIYAMFLLIESAPLELSTPQSYKLDWVHVPEDPIVKPIETVITKPEPVESKPVVERVLDRAEFDVSDSVHIPVEKITFEPTPVDSIYKSDQLTLVFRNSPVYPPNKLNRGVEGYVVVGFSVDPVGQVYDAYVIESEPKGAFEKSALAAIAKFKYKPRYKDDRAVSTEGQRYLFRFEIND